MHVSIQQVDPATRKLTVELNYDDLHGYVEHVERELTRDVSIDGFRPGKAPREKVRAQVGPDAIRERALSVAVEKSLDQAVAEQKLDVRSASGLRVTENTPQRLVYEVTLALYPDIALPAFDTIKVSPRPVQVSDTEVAEALETIRRYRATFSPKDGPAAMDDRVEVDFVVRNDGAVVTGGESKNHPLILGGKSFLPGFEEQLVGMTAGQEKDFTLHAPKDYFQKDIADKELAVHVKVGLVQTVQIPVLDDAFARVAGKFSTLDDLRANVRDGLEQEKSEKEKERLRLAILDDIIKKTSIALSPAIVNEQLDLIMAGFEQQLRERGMELPMYLTHIGKTREQLRKDWQADAERQAKIQLVTHAIGRTNDITVTDEEIEQQLATVVQAIILRQNLPPEQLDLARIRHQVRQQALNDKILDFIEQRCAV